MNRTVISLTATLLLASPAVLNAAEKKPLLWAVYYAWYETATGPHHRWSQWSDDKSANVNPKPKSKAQPLIGFYDSDDPGVVRWHIRLAKAAGIDAFLTSWWGDANISGAAFEKTILPVAAEEHFKVALCSELAQFHHDVKVLTRQMADVLRRTKDSPGLPARERQAARLSLPDAVRAEAHAGDVLAIARGCGGGGGPGLLDDGQDCQPEWRRTDLSERMAEDFGNPDAGFLRHVQHQADLEIHGPRTRLCPPRATSRTPLARRFSFPRIPVTTTAVSGPTTSLSSPAKTARLCEATCVLLPKPGRTLSC